MESILGSIKRLTNYLFSRDVERKIEEEAGYSELRKVPHTRHNYTFRTEEETAIKFFTNLSFIELDLALLHLLNGELSVPAASQRARAEENFREELPDIKTPEVIERDGRILEEEFIDGEGLEEAIRTGKVEPGETGRKIGEIISKIEEKGFCIWDITANDFIYSEGDIFLTDAEWFSKSDSSLHPHVVKANFYSASKALPEDKRKEVLEGFKEEQGEFTRAQRIYGTLAYYLL
jgi:tRNA A-37 threonylcarbamoyl transferase component Bud32